MNKGIFVVVLLAIAGAFIGPSVRLVLLTGSGYVSKIVCSVRFVQGRTDSPQDDITMTELRRPILQLFSYKIDRTGQTLSVTTSFMGWGLFSRSAYYHPEYGCSLLGADEEGRVTDIRPQSHQGLERQAAELKSSTVPWIDGNKLDKAAMQAVATSARVDMGRLRQAVDALLDDRNRTLATRKNTRAVVVLHKGQLLTEAYAVGFSSHTPMAGWSMTKSVINALIGIRIQQGKLSLSDPLLKNSPLWRALPADDPRRAVTVQHALWMSTGLAFEEIYDAKPRDPSIMLFTEPSTAAYAANKSLEHPVATHFSYASGTSNLLSHTLRHTFESWNEYARFPRQHLFSKIGMHSMVMEMDQAGDFVGSSFSHATARDWARFGQLYLNDGVWHGERLFPGGWVEETRTCTPAGNAQGQYGMHWWLAGSCEGQQSDIKRRHPVLPCDTFMASGFEGQFVIVIPSRDLVVVRLGCSQVVHDDEPMDTFLAELMQSVPAPASPAVPAAHTNAPVQPDSLS